MAESVCRYAFSTIHLENYCVYGVGNFALVLRRLFKFITKLTNLYMHLKSNPATACMSH